MAPRFDEIGFLLMDVAKMCNVDAARVMVGEGIAAIQDSTSLAGFNVIAYETFNAPDGTPARLVLLSLKPRRLTDRERVTLRAMTLHAQMQLV